MYVLAYLLPGRLKMMISRGFSRLDQTLTLLSQRFLHPLSTLTWSKRGYGRLEWGQCSHNSGPLQSCYGDYGARSFICQFYGALCPNHEYQAKSPTIRP